MAHNKPNYIDIADLQRFSDATDSPRLQKAMRRHTLTPILPTSARGQGEEGGGFGDEEGGGDDDDDDDGDSSRYMAFSITSPQKCLELELTKDPNLTGEESLEMYDKITHALEGLVLPPSGF